MENEHEIPTFYHVKDKHDLAQLNGYEIENISESTGNSEGKSIKIFLKRESSDGRTLHREFMIACNGNKFITNEY